MSSNWPRVYRRTGEGLARPSGRYYLWHSYFVSYLSTVTPETVIVLYMSITALDVVFFIFIVHRYSQWLQWRGGVRKIGAEPPPHLSLLAPTLPFHIKPVDCAKQSEKYIKIKNNSSLDHPTNGLLLRDRPSPHLLLTTLNTGYSSGK